MKIKNLTVNLAITLTSFILICILFEVIFRLPSIKQKTGGNGPTLNQWVNSIHQNYEVNSFGFRDVEHQLQKPKNTFRIVILGDSVAYGQMVKPSLTFPRLLEKYLNQNSSINYEVINISLMGWNTVEQLQGLKEFGIKFNPDIILIAFYPNDLQVKQNPVDKEMFDSERPIIPIKSIDNYLDKNSYFYSFTRYRYNRLLEKQGKKIDYQTWQRYPFQENSRGFTNFKQALTEIKSISDNNHSKIIWVSLNFEPGWEKEIDLVSSTVRQLSISTLDMAPAFAQLKSEELHISPSDWHPSQKAHQIYAQVLNDYIQNINL